jgi:hypothetical protein
MFIFAANKFQIFMVLLDEITVFSNSNVIGVLQLLDWLWAPQYFLYN